MLEGDSIQYFGATIPVNLAAAVIAEVVLVGGAEYYRSTNKSPLGSVSSHNWLHHSLLSLDIEDILARMCRFA